MEFSALDSSHSVSGGHITKAVFATATTVLATCLYHREMLGVANVEKLLLQLILYITSTPLLH